MENLTYTGNIRLIEGIEGWLFFVQTMLVILADVSKSGQSNQTWALIHKTLH